MKKALTASMSHPEETSKELRADRQFAVAYLKAALEELDDSSKQASAGKRFTDHCHPSATRL